MQCKKSGIESIERSGSNTKTLKKLRKVEDNYILEEVIEGGKTIPAAQGTFGWGGVHDEFPLENSKSVSDIVYFYKVGNVFRKCTCGCTGNMTIKGNHSQDCQNNNLDDNHKYSVIWRYER